MHAEGGKKKKTCSADLPEIQKYLNEMTVTPLHLFLFAAECFQYSSLSKYTDS